jgi:hypothetical protein
MQIKELVLDAWKTFGTGDPDRIGALFTRRPSGSRRPATRPPASSVATTSSGGSASSGS